MTKLTDDECRAPCIYDGHQTCGDSCKMSVYEIDGQTAFTKAARTERFGAYDRNKQRLVNFNIEECTGESCGDYRGNLSKTSAD